MRTEWSGFSCVATDLFGVVEAANVAKSTMAIAAIAIQRIARAIGNQFFRTMAVSS